MTSTDADVEPDAGTLAEVEQLLQADGTLRRALVVLVGDHLHDDERTGNLVAELLSEDGFQVDAVITAPSERSRVRQALETAVVGGADLVTNINKIQYIHTVIKIQ